MYSPVRSAWYHWIEKSIIGFFSLLNIFGTQSSATKLKSNLLHVRITVCMCSNLSWLAHFDERTSAKVLLCFGLDCEMTESLLTRSCNPKNNLCLSHIFEEPFRKEKKMRAHANRTCRRLDFIFCMKLLRTLCTQYIQEWKKPIAWVGFPFQWYHSHADSIWPDYTFMGSVRWIFKNIHTKGIRYIFEEIFHLIEGSAFWELLGTVAWDGFQNYKIRQSAALFRFARWWNSLLTRSCNPKNNRCLSRIFEARFRGENKMRAHANWTCWRLDLYFLQNFVYNIFQSENKKTNSWFFYPMVPCRSDRTVHLYEV